MMELQNSFPPGWDSKVDKKTGKTFYINHYTRTTTWEDPRLKGALGTKQNPHLMQHFSNDHVLTQHGSPDLRRNYVYPSQSSPIPAFQIPGQHSPKYIPLQEPRINSRMSPLTFKSTQAQDSSLTNITDTEESVNKISAMFPTVSDTHIRLLLKKYHGREAVVISALQVEKHPITTPGPFTTPPPARNIYPGLHSSLQMTPPLGVRSYSRGVSPVMRFGSIITDSPRTGDNFRNSARPHSSPKLKLRYMKSIFPKAEETVILDVLTNSDNNIQKASEWLKKMGYDRKDPVKLQQQVQTKLEEQQQQAETQLNTEVPKIKTADEKTAIIKRLQERYKDIIEQVIMIALDSVHYNEDRASQILDIMVEEEHKTQSFSISKDEENELQSDVSANINLVPGTVSTSQSRQSFKSIAGIDTTDSQDRDCSRNNETERRPTFKSRLLTTTQGANPNIAMGANDKLLLMDYVVLEGANPNLRKGPQRDLAKGPNKSNLCEQKVRPIGPNPRLCKGAKPGLAKGSLFQQLRNIVNNESRGK